MCEVGMTLQQWEVKSILEGRKTRLTRVIRSQPPIGYGWKCWILDSTDKCDNNNIGCAKWTDEKETVNLNGHYAKPPCDTGDVIWIMETYFNLMLPGFEPEYIYKADIDFKDREIYSEVRWKSSIHMPRLAARIFLKVTDVRVVRLQDITEDDAMAEGVERQVEGWKSYDIIKTGMHKGEEHPFNVVPYKNAKLSFQSLWDSLHNNWNDNPLVFVVEFERLMQYKGESLNETKERM